MATMAMPRRGLANFQAETGTGFAQPNMNATRWMVSNWRDQQDARQDDRAHPVDVLQRIERQPPLIARRRIAQRQAPRSRAPSHAR